MTLMTLVAIGMTGCSETDESVATSIRSIALRPEDFEVSEELQVRGWLIRPAGKPVVVCSGISKARPPEGLKACVEVAGVDPALIEGAVTSDGTAWVRHPVTLACSVRRHLPGQQRAERLILRCDTMPKLGEAGAHTSQTAPIVELH